MSTRAPLRIFVGWDPREAEAYHVFCHSIIRHASLPVQIMPLVQSQLRASGIYTRAKDERAATEFSLTRFLVPHLSGYKGMSIFADCDMLMQADVHSVLDEVWTQKRDQEKAPWLALWCCKHNYVPRSETKMDGQAQTTYPRKNWSSFMVFDNAHCEKAGLTPEYVNTATPAQLHRFQWLEDSQIGALPIDWNYLADEYEPNGNARNIHYTNGGPWFNATQGCDMADLWLAERDLMSGAKAVA